MVEMNMDKKEPEEGVRVRVKRSPISGSGIARVHTSIIKMAEFEEGKAAEVSKDGKRRVLRLVADDIMEKGKISLRQKDLDKLGAREGDEVILSPIKGMGERITKGLSFLRTKGDEK
jgi:hypothetical protein